MFLLTASQMMKKCLRSNCRNLTASRSKFGNIFAFFESRYSSTNKPVERRARGATDDCRSTVLSTDLGRREKCCVQLVAVVGKAKS